MEKATKKWRTMAMIPAILVAAASSAHAQPMRRVVVHVQYGIDPTPGVRQAFELAQTQTSRIFGAIGVSLVWTDSTTDESAGGLLLLVRVLSTAETDRFLKDSRHVRDIVLGAAPRQTGRVYVFWDRVLRRAGKDKVLPYRVLGRVLAHEIGHHLLPAKGHSKAGIMREWLNFQLPTLPAFTEPEAEAIRMLLRDSGPANRQAGMNEVGTYEIHD